MVNNEKIKNIVEDMNATINTFQSGEVVIVYSFIYKMKIVVKNLRL